MTVNGVWVYGFGCSEAVTKPISTITESANALTASISNSVVYKQSDKQERSYFILLKIRKKKKSFILSSTTNKVANKAVTILKAQGKLLAQRLLKSMGYPLHQYMKTNSSDIFSL